jgi:hypothetical protein
MMAVDVELFGQLASGEQRRQTLTLESPMPVSDVAILLGVNHDEVGLITINGVQSSMQDEVPLTCRLCFFPPMSGG